jgi:FTR1 family protein
MWRTGRRMKGDIEGRLKASAARPGVAAFTGVFLFTLLMVSREGMETALLLMQLHQTTNLVLGAAVGSLAAAGVAMLWSRYGHRINLSLFFQATAIFLFVFVVQLVIKGAHEMSEQQYCRTRVHPQQHRVVGTRQHLRSCPDLPARDPAARLDRNQVARLQEPDLPAAGGAGRARLRRTIRRNRALCGFIF